MNMEELRREIRKHVEAAYALLPSPLEPAYPYRKRDDLKEKYEGKDWRELFNLLKSHSLVNNFSDELLHHLTATEELLGLYDRLGMKTAMEQLTDEEKRIIGECLRATALGPFFLDDWEFPTVFGVTHEEAVKIAEVWPNIEETDMTAKVIINNSINNLLGYPHGKHSEWSKYISVSPQQVDEILTKFRALTGMSNNNEKARDSKYFQNLM